MALPSPPSRRQAAAPGRIGAERRDSSRACAALPLASARPPFSFCCPAEAEHPGKDPRPPHESAVEPDSPIEGAWQSRTNSGCAAMSPIRTCARPGSRVSLPLGVQASRDRRQGEASAARSDRSGPRRRAGGWSQVAAARVKPGGRVIAIDLLKIAPITGVVMVQEDFRAAKLEGVRADIVLSDLAPNLSESRMSTRPGRRPGVRGDRFCRKTLKPDGVFLVKTFHGEAFARSWRV